MTNTFAFTPSYSYAKQVPFDKWTILKGDKVIVTSGKDTGKSGVVLRVYRKTNRVLVQGINQKFKRVNATDVASQGGIQQITRPIHVSNVHLIDPEKGVATKIIKGYLEDGSRARISKLTGSIVERKKDPAFSPTFRHKNKVDSQKDTPPAKVLEVTYKGEDFTAVKAQFEREMQEKERKEQLLWF